MQKPITLNKKQFTNELILFIVLSYLLTWFYIIPKALYSREITPLNIHPYFEILAAFGPALAALILVYVKSRKVGVQGLLSRILIWKVDLKWYFVALFLQPIIWLSALYIHVLLGGELPIFSNIPVFEYLNLSNIINPIYLAILIILAFFVQVVLLLGEEIGWRGFMLPKMLSITNWINSSLILGVIWTIWHIPLFYIIGSTQSNISLSLYSIDLIASTFLFTWIYFHTKGSILIAGLFHASINSSTVLLPILPSVAGSTSPYIIGIILKCIIVMYIAIKNKNEIKVKETIGEGLGIRKIGMFFDTIFGFFEQIVENMYKSK